MQLGNKHTDIFMQNMSSTSARVFNIDEKTLKRFLQHDFERFLFNFAKGFWLVPVSIEQAKNRVFVYLKIFVLAVCATVTT